VNRFRKGLVVGMVIAVVLFFLPYYAGLGLFQRSSTTSRSTTINTTATIGNASTWSYSFQITINYSGSWHLTYWGAAGGTVTLDNVNGNNLNGTGNYQNTITLQGPHGSESELCAGASKTSLDNNLKLILAVSAFTNSTSAPNSPVEVCVWVGQ
jgi:hypothetical protein